jgi:hypothetical protein
MRIVNHFILLVTLSFTIPQVSIHSQNIQSRIQQLSKRADVILTGKVINQKSQWNHDQTKISTQSTIQVYEYLKGNNIDKSITVTTPGGEVGDVGELYTHMPKFSNDEEVLLFVKKDKNNADYKIVDGEDGKLTLLKNEKTGELVTSFSKNISSLKTEIKSYIENK